MMTLAGALESLDSDEPLPEIAHRKAMEELRDYFFCGGMPGVRLYDGPHLRKTKTVRSESL